MYVNLWPPNAVLEHDKLSSEYWLQFLKKKKVASDFQFTGYDCFLRVHLTRSLIWFTIMTTVWSSKLIATQEMSEETKKGNNKSHNLTKCPKLINFLSFCPFLQCIAVVKLWQKLCRLSTLLTDSYQFEEVRVVTEDGAVRTGLQVGVWRGAGDPGRRGLEVNHYNTRSSEPSLVYNHLRHLLTGFPPDFIMKM